MDFDRANSGAAASVVEITALEFRLLAAFVKRAGRVLSREQLLEQAWGGTDVGDRVVDTQVVNLRKKIEPDAIEPRYLIALRGIGYRFEDEDSTELGTGRLPRRDGGYQTPACREELDTDGPPVARSRGLPAHAIVR